MVKEQKEEGGGRMNTIAFQESWKTQNIKKKDSDPPMR